jgi:hypothetical protein
LPFREDILRGIRLFAIVFAAILLCVAGYRVLKPSPDAPGATQAPPEAASPAPAVPASDAEAHPLIVPEAPPVPGTPASTKVVKKVVRPRVADPGVPPPPPINGGRRGVQKGQEYAASETSPLPIAPVENSSDSATKGVGYKSLIDANPNRPPVEAAAAPAPEQPPAAEPAEKAAKGNRFFRAVGKIFHPSPKKESMPLTLQPQQ